MLDTHGHRTPRLLVLSSFPPAVGGGELQTLAQLLCMAETGVRITVIDLRPRGHRESTDEVPGIHVRRIRVPDVPVASSVVFFSKLALLALVEARRHDVAQFNHIGTALIVASPLVGLMGLPRVLVIWGSAMRGVGPFARGWRNQIARKLARRCDAVVALASNVVPNLVRSGFDRRKILFIPNGVDTRRFRPRSGTPDTGNGPSPGVVISVGRLVPAKGWDVLLDAWADLMATQRGAVLRIVGDGPLRDTLEQQIDALGIRESVQLMGARNDLPELLPQAAVYVSASRTEGMSNALLEAISAGLPVVATRVGGAEDIVEDSTNGVLVPPENPQALSSAMKSILADPRKRDSMSRASREIAETRFSLQAIAEQYLGLYRSLGARQERAR